VTDPLRVGDRVVHVRPAMADRYPPGTIVPDPAGCPCGLVSVQPDGGGPVWVLPRDQIRRRTDEDDAAPRAT